MKLRKLQDAVAIDGILVFLDSKLCLSEKQLDDIRQRFKAVWDSRLNEQSLLVPMNGLIGGRMLVDLLKANTWEKILTPIQFEEFNHLDQPFGIMMANQLAEMYLNGGETNKLKKICDTATELKLAEYKAMFDIPESQERVLRIAQKGVSAGIQKRAREYGESLAEDPIKAGTDLRFAAAEPLVDQCAKHPIWKKTLAKVFTQEQLAAIDRREDSRRAVAVKQMANVMAISISREQLETKLDLDQHKQLVDLIEKATESKGSVLYSVAKGMAAVSDEDYQKILTPTHWETVSPMIEDMRKTFKQDSAEE